MIYSTQLIIHIVGGTGGGGGTEKSRGYKFFLTSSFLLCGSTVGITVTNIVCCVCQRMSHGLIMYIETPCVILFADLAVRSQIQH